MSCSSNWPAEILFSSDILYPVKNSNLLLSAGFSSQGLQSPNNTTFTSFSSVYTWMLAVHQTLWSFLFLIENLPAISVYQWKADMYLSMIQFKLDPTQFMKLPFESMNGCLLLFFLNQAAIVTTSAWRASEQRHLMVDPPLYRWIKSLFLYPHLCQCGNWLPS